jgi:O-antigen biosynthesis protein WbqP
MRTRKKSIYPIYVKRFLDMVFSSALLFFLLLPIFIIAVIIRSESRGNAIFKQNRIGRGGRVFVCYKFRTMQITAPKSISAAEFKDREKYITRVGAFLRRTSLDEIPQLFNVLKGNMSLIGPRPLICEEQDIHKERMDKGVYALRPGITGMAQINGRNLLCDEEKLKSDSYYLQNIRIGLDAKILFRTFFKVAKGDGINAQPKE